MSLTTISGSASAATPSATSHRMARAESAGTSGGTTTAGNIEAAVSDGASAAVAFSEKALHALKQAGETAVDSVADGSSSVAGASKTVVAEVEDLAKDAWRGIKHAAKDVASFAESVADDVVDGVEDAVSATKTAATALGHYAGIALDETTDAASDVARDAVVGVSTASSKVVAQLI